MKAAPPCSVWCNCRRRRRSNTRKGFQFPLMLLYIISGWEELSIDNTGAICFCGLLYYVKGRRFMHFHYPSFLLGLLLGIILIVLLIYLILWWLVKDDERWFRRHLDDYVDEDDSLK